MVGVRGGWHTKNGNHNMDSNMKLFAATPNSKVNCKRQRELAQKYAVIISKANSKKTEKKKHATPSPLSLPLPRLQTEGKYNLKAYIRGAGGRWRGGRAAYVVCCLFGSQSMQAQPAKHTCTNMHTDTHTHAHCQSWVSATFEWELKASDLQINQASIVFKMPTNPSRASCERYVNWVATLDHWNWLSVAQCEHWQH